MADGFMPKSLDMHVMPLSRHQSRSVRLYCVYVYDLSPNSIQRLIFIQREVWNSAKKLLGIIQQKVHKVMLDGTIRTRTLENLPNSVATGSTTTIFYPNWKGPAGDPVNKEFLHAVIQDVKASEVSMLGAWSQSSLNLSMYR